MRIRAYGILVDARTDVDAYYKSSAHAANHGHLCSAMGTPAQGSVPGVSQTNLSGHGRKDEKVQ